MRTLAPVFCLLCACGAFQPPASVQAIGLKACRSTDIGNALGAHFTALAKVELQGPLRVIYPDQSVTLDIDPRRLNAMIDGQGRITQMFCG